MKSIQAKSLPTLESISEAIKQIEKTRAACHYPAMIKHYDAALLNLNQNLLSLTLKMSKKK